MGGLKEFVKNGLLSLFDLKLCRYTGIKAAEFSFNRDLG